MATDHSRDSLRKHFIEQRTRLGPAKRVAAANGVAETLEQLPEFLVDQRVAGYWAVGGELPLHAVVARLRARGQHYHLPVISSGRMLHFAPLLPNSTLQPNRHGIPEPECAEHNLLTPEQMELVLVPLLAFDRRGRRLGTGGGYYDRSFGFLRDVARPAQALLVGIGYSFQEVPEFGAEHWDIPMDFIATEKELIDCLPSELSKP